MYGLTPQAEGLFPKAYGPVLRELLDVLAERVGSGETEALLRAVGSRMADGRDVPAGGGVRERLEAGVGLLNDMGGLADSRSAATPSLSAVTAARWPPWCRAKHPRPLAEVRLTARCRQPPGPRALG